MIESEVRWRAASRGPCDGLCVPVVVALGAVVVVPVVLNYLSLSNFADLVVRIARWPVMFVVLALALASSMLAMHLLVHLGSLNRIVSRSLVSLREL